MLRITLIVLLLVGTQANDNVYKGPKSLGPFRIDKNVLMKDLFQRVGQPANQSGDTLCYKSDKSHGYLMLTRMANNRAIAGDAEISDFPNCLDTPVQTTADDLKDWKTDEGIGLGSSKADVIRMYGKPSHREAIGTDYRWIIRGAPAKSKKNPEVGTEVLSYTGVADDLSGASFGIRDGIVAWILLSQNE